MCELNWISVAKKKFHIMVKNIYFSYRAVKCSYLEMTKGEIEQVLPISKWQSGYVTLSEITQFFIA